MEYVRTIAQVNFAKLWLAQVLSQIAGNMLNFALIILVYDLTVGSRFGSFSVALLVLSFAIPSVLAAPAAGRYVDYWNRKHILFFTNALRAGLVLLYIPAADNLLLILLLTFAIAVVTQFFLPAEAATIPRVVERKYLLPANSLFIFSVYGAFMVGYSLSGPVVQAFGKDGSYFVTAGMFLFATILTALIPSQKLDKIEGEPLPEIHLANQLKENWQIITAHPDRWFSLVQMAITQGLVFVLITLAPALSQALLHIPLQQASQTLIIPVGIGMVLGVLMVSGVVRLGSKREIIEMTLVVAGIALTLLGLSGQLYRTVDGSQIASAANIGLIVGMIMLILGSVNSMINAVAQTLLQETTDDHNRGRVFGSLQMLINVATTLPVFAAGLLADVLSVTKVITGIGLALTIYALYMLWHGRSSRLSAIRANQ